MNELISEPLLPTSSSRSTNVAEPSPKNSMVMRSPKSPMLLSPKSSNVMKSPSLRGALPSLFRSNSATSSNMRLKVRSDVFSWGWALNGQLGVDVDLASGFAAQGGNISAPTIIPRFSVENVVQVCCGSRCTFALTNTGMVFSFGRCDDGQLGHNELGAGASALPRVIERLISHPIKHIACRNAHVVAVSEEKELWTWGRGDEGQLGHGDTCSQYVPKRVSGLAGIAIRTAAAGRQHSLAVTEAGEVYGMGLSAEGQLGLGSEEIVATPMRVEVAGMQAVRDVCCGSRHSIALTESGDVYVWGWNAYGQLGLRTFTNEFAPVKLSLPFVATNITCGFRQSFAQDDQGQWWGWGWNQYHQLAHSHHSGLNKSCSAPQPCNLLHSLGHVTSLVSGGRHSLAITDRGTVYSFGRGSDGQLGHGDIQDRDYPMLVQQLSSHHVTAAACGWAHTIAVAKVVQREDITLDVPKRPILTRGDLDAFFGVFFNHIIGLLLISSLCTHLLDMPAEYVSSHILPGCGYALGMGSLFFGLQCRSYAKTSEHPPTAQPFGLDTPILLSTVFLVMAPLRAQHSDYRIAYRTGLFSAVIIGTLQILGAFVGDWVRANVPRPALLAALAGIGIGFIAEGFVFQIFSDPVIGLVPLVVIWVAYASGITLPLGVPGSIAAVLIGTTIAFIAWGSGYNFWKPFSSHVDSEPHPGHFALSLIVEAFGSSDSWSQLPLIIPLCVINIVGSLVNLEGAASVGDNYNTRHSMIATGLCTLFGAALGSPFPCCIFMGHPAWKAVGAREGYDFLCSFAAITFCVFNGVTAITQIIPVDSTVSILLWVGLAVTAQAFETLPGKKTYHLAVAVGILPAIASWAQQLIGNYLALAKSSYYQIQEEENNSFFMRGMISFSQGFLLLSVLLATLMVNIMDRMFNRAALVCMILSGCSFFGFVHAYELHPSQIKPLLKPMAAPDEALGYLLCAVVLFILHVLGDSREDQSGPLAWLMHLPSHIRSLVSHGRWNRQSLNKTEVEQERSKQQQKQQKQQPQHSLVRPGGGAGGDDV